MIFSLLDWKEETKCRQLFYVKSFVDQKSLFALEKYKGFLQHHQEYQHYQRQPHRQTYRKIVQKTQQKRKRQWQHHHGHEYVIEILNRSFMFRFRNYRKTKRRCLLCHLCNKHQMMAYFSTTSRRKLWLVHNSSNGNFQIICIHIYSSSQVTITFQLFKGTVLERTNVLKRFLSILGLI